jgi:hypothetical protein
MFDQLTTEVLHSLRETLAGQIARFRHVHSSLSDDDISGDEAMRAVAALGRDIERRQRVLEALDAEIALRLLREQNDPPKRAD